MTDFMDGLIALWVIACLSSLVIAIAQERPVLPWLLLALTTGPVALILLFTKAAPHGARPDGGLCASCFSRLRDDDPFCPRCRDQRARSNTSWDG